MLCLTDVLITRTAGVPARPPGPPSLRTAVRDPYPPYRTHYPLVYDEPFGAWLVSRYDAFRTDPAPLAHDTGRHTGPDALLARLTAEHGLRALLTALPALHRAPGAHPVPEDLVRRSPRPVPVRIG